MAGTRGYLPTVGPVELRFEAESSGLPVEPLLELPSPEISAQSEIPLPITVPDTNNPPIAPTEPEVIITIPERSADTNAPSFQTVTNDAISPQMLMRFFLPGQAGGVSREAIVVPQTGNNNPPPPQPSSSATFVSPQ